MKFVTREWDLKHKDKILDKTIFTTENSKKFKKNKKVLKSANLVAKSFLNDFKKIEREPILGIVALVEHFYYFGQYTSVWK